MAGVDKYVDGYVDSPLLRVVLCSVAASLPPCKQLPRRLLDAFRHLPWMLRDLISRVSDVLCEVSGPWLVIHTCRWRSRFFWHLSPVYTKSWEFVWWQWTRRPRPDRGPIISSDATTTPNTHITIFESFGLHCVAWRRLPRLHWFPNHMTMDNENKSAEKRM